MPSSEYYCKNSLNTKLNIEPGKLFCFLQDIVTCCDSFLHISVLMVYTLNHYALVSGYFFLSTSPVLPHPPVLPSHTPYFSSFLFRATGAESSVQIYCL